MLILLQNKTIGKKLIFKDKKKLYITIFSLIIFVLIWAFISAAFITKSFKKDLAENKLNNKKILVEDLLLTETKNGKKYWEIYADGGYYEDNEKIAYIINSVGNFYDENEEVIASFKSPQGIINSETGEIKLFNRSELMYKDFTSIIADEFNYQGEDKPILAKGKVIIKNPQKFKITADNAYLTDNMTKISVKGKVITKIYEKGK